MTSYFLISDEPSIDPERIQERTLTGARKLLGKQDVTVKRNPKGVAWSLSNTVRFSVNISDAELMASEAEDLASFATPGKMQEQVRKAKSRFLCHCHDSRGNSDAEFHYFLSLVATGHQIACFRIDDRQYVPVDFDEKALFKKERLPTGLSREAPENRRKLVRVFADPLPAAASFGSEEEFIAQVSDIPSEASERFARWLTELGDYEELKADEHGRHFKYVKNEGWRLQACLGPKEIFFSVLSRSNTAKNTLFEVYQLCSEVVGDMPLRIYDVKNDEWFDR